MMNLTNDSSPGLAAKVAAFADAYGMLPQGGTILVAVSGGTDSMALLTLLEELAESRALTLHAAHYNHQLRGAESQRDEDFVQQWCQSRGIPLTIGTGDVAQAARETGDGVEETARAMRYGFLTELAQTMGADRLATAHHADDNAETVLLHLTRGTGLDGLTGIPPVRGILVRPLLATPRSELAAYLQEKQVPHVEDSSNESSLYARNRLRHEVMPVLQGMNPSFVATLTANLVHLRQDRDLLHTMAEQVAKTARLEEGQITISAKALSSQPHPIAVRVVKRLLERLEHYQISAVHLEQILELAESASPSASIRLPEDLFVWREYENLCLCPARLMPPAFSLRILTGPGTFTLDNGWVIVVEEVTCPEVPATGEFEWHVDMTHVTYPLVIRPRQTGDQLRLPGRRTKTLKKWFIDEKIPRHHREILPVVADDAGLLGAAGLGINAPRTAYPNHPALHIQVIPKETHSPSDTDQERM